MEDIRKEKTMEDLTAEETEKEDGSTAEEMAETMNTAGEPCTGQEDAGFCEDTEREEGDGTPPDENAEEEAAKEADPEDTASASETESGSSGDKSGFGLFGRKKKDKKDEQIAELKDRVQRQMAEFDNFRKRTEKEKAAMFEIGAKSVIEKMLPVVDNFERGLGTTDETSEDPFVVGMHKIYRQMLTTLEELEVKPIPAVGEEFNPDFHNAVLHVEDEDAGENIIVEELQKGYTYRGSVVRHSMVKVAN